MEMKEVWEKNPSVCGARELWHAMKPEEIDIAGFNMERLMRWLSIHGVRRGGKVRTTCA